MRDLEKLTKMLLATGEIKPGISTGEYLLVASAIAIAERLDTAVVQMSLMNGFLDGILKEMKKQNPRWRRDIDLT